VYKLQDSHGSSGADNDDTDDGLSENAGLVRIWVAMQTTLCGQSAVSEEMISKSSRNIKLSK